MPSLHATTLLAQPEKVTVGPAVVLTGNDRVLKHDASSKLIQLILGPEGDAEFSVRRFQGGGLEYQKVGDELKTSSLWGGKRIVVVEEADEFVSEYRARLENLFQKPPKGSVLLLEVTSWPKTTRLAKWFAEHALEIDCSELVGAKLLTWLIEHTQREHGKQLPRDAATLLIELAGTSLGLLQQELSKLAAYVGDEKRIPTEVVSKLVGGWRAETTWNMLDAVRTGKVSEALECLDKLLVAGEAPQKILGGVNFVFRKLSAATERARGGAPLTAALQQAGVFPKDKDISVAYLRRIGRNRAEQITQLLLKADADLKGGSRLPERIQLERLILDLAGATEPAL